MDCCRRGVAGAATATRASNRAPCTPCAASSRAGRAGACEFRGAIPAVYAAEGPRREPTEIKPASSRSERHRAAQGRRITRGGCCGSRRAYPAIAQRWAESVAGVRRQTAGRSLTAWSVDHSEWLHDDTLWPGRLRSRALPALCFRAGECLLGCCAHTRRQPQSAGASCLSAGGATHGLSLMEAARGSGALGHRGLRFHPDAREGTCPRTCAPPNWR